MLLRATVSPETSRSLCRNQTTFQFPGKYENQRLSTTKVGTEEPPPACDIEQWVGRKPGETAIDVISIEDKGSGVPASDPRCPARRQ